MPDTTIGALCARFETSALVEGTTKTKIGSAVKRFTLFHGPIPAAELTTEIISAWQAWMLDQGLATATVRSYFGAMSQLYGWAVIERLVDENPFRRAHQVREVRKGVACMSSEDVADLSDAAAEMESADPSCRVRWVFMLDLAAVSGLRVGEIFNLRWEDIDLEAECVRIRYRPDLEAQYWRWGTKGKSDRVVPIFQQAIEAAYRLKELAPWRYPTLKQVACKRLQAGIGHLTESQRKNPYRNFYKQLGEIKSFANGRRAANRQEPIKDGGMHILRHTAISTWFRKGVTVPEAKYLAGHASELTTLRVYAHVTQDEAVDSLRKKLTMDR